MTSDAIPQWLVRNAGGHPVAVVLARTSSEACNAVASSRKGWTARPLGQDHVAGFVAPIVVMTFPIVRVPAGAMRDADTTVQAGVARRALTAAAGVMGLTCSQARHQRSLLAVQAKCATWWVLVNVAGLSRAGAGRATGHHHTTVLNGLRRAEVHRSGPMYAAALHAAREAVVGPDAC